MLLADVQVAAGLCSATKVLLPTSATTADDSLPGITLQVACGT